MATHKDTLWFPVPVTRSGAISTVKLMRVLKLKRVEVLGHLDMLYTFAIYDHPDGNLGQVDPDDIAIAIEYEGDGPGLVAGLKYAGILDSTGQIVDWATGFGRAIVAREKTRERLQEYRNAKRPDPPVLDVTVTSVNVPTNDDPTSGNSYNGVTNEIVTVTNGVVHSTDLPTITDDLPTNAQDTPRTDIKKKIKSKININSDPIDLSVQQASGAEATTSSGDPDFEEWFTKDFWDIFPARTQPSGRQVKLDKVKVHDLLMKLPKKHRANMAKAVQNYAASGQMARDPIRFIRDRWWVQWVDMDPSTLPLDASNGRPNNGHSHQSPFVTGEVGPLTKAVMAAQEARPISEAGRALLEKAEIARQQAREHQPGGGSGTTPPSARDIPGYKGRQ